MDTRTIFQIKCGKCNLRTRNAKDGNDIISRDMNANALTRLIAIIIPDGGISAGEVVA